MAVAILAVGMLFVGGTFVLAIHFSTLSTERTISAVVAEEAVVKIRLYGFEKDPNTVDQTPYERLMPSLDQEEFLYPSTPMAEAQRQYSWSALCRRIGADPRSQRVQVTVFICRIAGIATSLSPERLINPAGSTDRLYPGSMLVGGATGQLYRVVNLDGGLKLDRNWQDQSDAAAVWAVLRPKDRPSGRNPCITVYQTELVVPHSGTHAMGPGKTTLYATAPAPRTGRVR